jgi:CPA2 family monovalent cation:H+ antiporter-2
MALFLPVSVGLLVATGVVDTLVDIAIAALAVAVAFAITLRFGDRLSRVVFVSSDELLLLSILGAALLVAGTAEQVHAPAAVGALLVGIALSGPAADSARVVLTPLRDLFAAVFFLFFGLELDPATVVPTLPAAAGLAAVTAVAKVFTGRPAGRASGCLDASVPARCSSLEASSPSSSPGSPSPAGSSPTSGPWRPATS